MENLIRLKDSIGIETPFLNDVLKWYSSYNRDRYSHFQVNDGKAYFIIYDGDETDKIEWDLTFVSLENQSSELIDWLAELIYE